MHAVQYSSWIIHVPGLPSETLTVFKDGPRDEGELGVVLCLACVEGSCLTLSTAAEGK